MAQSLTKTISNPEFGARVGRLFDIYTTDGDLPAYTAANLLTFLFDDVPLPEEQGDGDVGRTEVEGQTTVDDFVSEEE